MRVACIWFSTAQPVNKLAEHFLKFSPQICIRDPQAIFIEIGRCRNLYTEDEFLKNAHEVLKFLEMPATIAIGNDLIEALCFAQFSTYALDHLPLDVMTEIADPFARDLILRKSVQNIITSFEDLGVKSIAQFKKIPVVELMNRFSALGRFCHQRLNERSHINWPYWQPEEVIFERKEFPYFEFYGELDPILFELKSQLDRIFSRLEGRHLKARKLQVEIGCEKNSVHVDHIRTLDFEFFAPQSATKGTLRILKERLSKEFEKRPVLSPIESIQTKILATTPAKPGQKNIFNDDQENLEAIYSFHNQLVEMLGIDNVFQAELTEDRRPEKSWKKKFGLPHEEISGNKNLSNIIPRRPTYLLKYPVKIDVTGGYVHMKGKRYSICEFDRSVERISGGWFESPAGEIKNTFDRNYHEIEIEGNRRLFVFQTPTGQYFLHGYYG